MRNLLLTVVASCALVAVMPAAALAHGRHHHSRGHVHHRTFDSTSSGASAGTVQSFTGGVLTIALSNGSTVSGTVTGDTMILCQSSSDSSGWQGHDSGGQGGDQGQGDDDQGQGDNQGQGDDDQGQGDDDRGGGSCSSSALTNGAAVSAAELTISSAGSVWKYVALAAPATTSTSSTPSSSS